MPPLGGDDHRLDAIADRHLDVAVGVLQFRQVDLGLAFAAHVDEGHVRAERDDGALDGLAPLELARLDGRLEHRCEIFFLLFHLRLRGNWTLIIIQARRLGAPLKKLHHLPTGGGSGMMKGSAKRSTEAMSNNNYDVVIAGGGIAGLTAGLLVRARRAKDTRRDGSDTRRPPPEHRTDRRLSRLSRWGSRLRALPDGAGTGRQRRRGIRGRGGDPTRGTRGTLARHDGRRRPADPNRRHCNRHDARGRSAFRARRACAARASATARAATVRFCARGLSASSGAEIPRCRRR